MGLARAVMVLKESTWEGDSLLKNNEYLVNNDLDSSEQCMSMMIGDFGLIRAAFHYAPVYLVHFFLLEAFPGYILLSHKKKLFYFRRINES